MWTKFQIFQVFYTFYTNVNSPYQIYFECDNDTAVKIFKHQSKVYKQYYSIEDDKPIIENTGCYRTIDDSFIQIYDKEHCEKYIDEYFSFDCLEPF